jgi:hypothetical protein
MRRRGHAVVWWSSSQCASGRNRTAVCDSRNILNLKTQRAVTHSTWFSTYCTWKLQRKSHSLFLGNAQFAYLRNLILNFPSKYTDYNSTTIRCHFTYVQCLTAAYRCHWIPYILCSPRHYQSSSLSSCVQFSVALTDSSPLSLPEIMESFLC